MDRTSYLRVLLATAAAGVIGQSLVAAPALAQEAQAQESLPGDIVVTARKREESLQDVPIAITALDSASLEKRNIANLNDVADVTPSMYLSNSGSGRADRSNQQIIIRGMTPSSSPTSNGNVSVFIDGAPVTGGFVEGIGDLARVEVLKGPQSAYFGRATFAGAVNLVTKDPGNELGGSIEGQIASNNWTNVVASLEGAIIPDKLLFRVSGRHFYTDGDFDNPGGSSETLGQQESTSLAVTLIAKPTENLTFRVFGLGWHDDDGPGPLGKFARQDYNCDAGLGRGLNYVCGKLPGSPTLTPASNVIMDPLFRSQVIDNPNVPLLFDNLLQTEAGMKRRAYHVHGGLTWDMPFAPVSISALASWNQNHYATLNDLDLEDTRGVANPNFTGSNANLVRPYIDYQSYVEYMFDDWSGELRAASTGSGPFTWTIGANYTQALSTPNANALYPTGYRVSTGAVINQAKTWSGFFGLGYTLGIFNLSFDGRYQIDNIYSRRRVYDKPTDTLLKATYKNFLPRVSLTVEPTRDLTVYGSWSKGMNPGAFNASLATASQAVQDAAFEQTGAQTTVKPEKLEQWELGVKGRLFGTLSYDVSAYYGTWNDQIISVNAVVPAGGSGNQTQVQTFSANAGKTRLAGIEGQLDWRATDNLAFNGGVGYNYSEIVDYVCVTCAVSITGSSDVSGNSLPRVPSVNATAGAQYTADLPAPILGGLLDQWYLRADYIYKNRMYETEANLAWTPDTHLVNLRAGLSSDRARLEAFVLNLTNERTYTSIVRNVDVLRSNTNDILVGLRTGRQVGARFRYNF
ncbi:TonB-dependent receptor [Novosphingobium kaempferiae]|uniref:TonB-dependent receptor n=1 Tax=Novosphingobium kaempferiae TaxID=2896849 RepID=UPI001E5AD94F|nr:TonB-dependent receptor [Novosphingobium kaempferiae]